jgi:hypothetical protein
MLDSSLDLGEFLIMWLLLPTAPGQLRSQSSSEIFFNSVLLDAFQPRREIDVKKDSKNK